MKIVEIHTQNLGAVPDGSLSFVDDWTGKIEKRILFTGVNGCGKSTLLRAIAMMWEAFGYWLEQKTFVGNLKKDEKNEINIAIILEKEQKQFGLIFGNIQFCHKMFAQYGHLAWIGESYDPKLLALVLGGNDGAVQKYQSLDQYFPNDDWFHDWGHQFILSKISNQKLENFPNLMYLDAEKRRWVPPTKNIGKYISDDLEQRWLIKYEVNDDWHGQLEQTLINLKLLDEKHFNQIIDGFNQFLNQKAIQKQPQKLNNKVRLMVKAKSNQYEHGLDELSSGEHQVLIMLFLTLRWLQKGGIILIDEPDLYLHPSLVQGFLATLEYEADKLDTQIIITSHSDDVWKRYENMGVRIDMSEGKYHVR